MQTNIETVTIRNMEPQDVDGIINDRTTAYMETTITGQKHLFLK